MKRYLSLLFCALLVSCLAAGCGRKEAAPEKPKQETETPVPTPKPKDSAQKPKAPEIEDSETGTPFSQIKIQNWDDKKEKPKVKETGENVVVENKASTPTPDTSVKKDDIPKTETPKNSFAAKITEANKLISWAPKWRYKGIGGPWLPSAKLSADRSTLAIVETTGEDDGPYGSRIVFVNMHEWSIIKVIEMNDRNISAICFIPKSTLLACWSEKQVSMKQPYMLSILDCRSGKVVSSSTLIKSPISGLAADLTGQTLAAKVSDSKTIYFFQVDKLSENPRTLESANLGGGLAVSPENLLGVAGDKSIELFSMEGGRPVSNIQLPDGFAATDIAFAGNEHKIVVMRKDGPAYVFKNKIKKQLSELSTGLAFFNSKDKTLYLAQKLRGEMFIYKDELYDEFSEKFQPIELRPRGSGDFIWCDALEGPGHRFSYLSTMGELCVLHKPKDRWMKDLLVEPKR